MTIRAGHGRRNQRAEIPPLGRVCVCIPCKLDPDVGLWAAMQPGCCCFFYCHTTASFCPPAARPGRIRPISQPPCSQTWQQTLPERGRHGGGPGSVRIKEFQLRQSRGLQSIGCVARCDLSNPGVCVSIPPLSSPRSFHFCLFVLPEAWNVMDVNSLLAGVIYSQPWEHATRYDSDLFAL